MDGLPTVINTMTIELVHDAVESPFVLIGTYGRGFWRRDLDALPGGPLLADGFEAGSFVLWSSANP